MVITDTMILFDLIKDNLPNGFYKDVNGNYCCVIGKYLISICRGVNNVEIDLFSCHFGCFDNLLDWYIIKKVEDVEKYITQFIDYIKER